MTNGFFWLANVLAAVVGWVLAEILGSALGLGAMTMLVTTGLVSAMMAQIHAEHYVPGLYWLIVVLAGMFGPLATDNLVDIFGVPLPVTTIVFAVLLAADGVAWYLGKARPTRRLTLYWLAVVFTLALGSAASDLGVPTG